MKIFYNIVLQMAGTYEPDDKVMETASRHIGFLKSEIDELDTHSATLSFHCSTVPTAMKQKVRNLLTECNRIYYADVIYRFEHEMTPDRFVIWQNGKMQEYTGHVMFVEDEK